MFDLVIFDCDGVLVDSEALVAHTYSDFFKQFGIVISAQELGEEYAGKTDFDLMQEIRDRFPEAVLPDDAQQQASSIYKTRLENELETIDGIEDMLKSIAQPKCVCSNSGYKRLLYTLDMTGLLEYFDTGHVFSASFVDNPKPAPDLHLLAAKEMGYAPDKCVVIEDSITGVQAARSAGMQAYGFVGAGHLGPKQAGRLLEAGASEIFSTMRDLHQHLNAIGIH